MSFSKKKRDAIQHYMMEKIASRDPLFVEKTVDAFQTTKNTIYRYLRELTASGAVEKTKTGYRLLGSSHKYRIPIKGLRSEDDDTFFVHTILPQLTGLEQNVIHIWYYCFTEMMNNVIDHSQASEAVVYFMKDPVNTTVLLRDNGIGIFKKIRSYFHYSTLEDAILELFKGKLSTDKKNHSGEGIFFSSRLLDVFAAISDGKIFSHTEYSEILDDLSESSFFPHTFQKGTAILMRLTNASKKTTKEIMDQYSDEAGGFVRTRIPLKNVFPDYPVSRSQAKRLCHRFDSFSEVELDFEGIHEIGQGFAHELFVVYTRKHPESRLIPFNTNLDVQRMIYHVTSPAKE